MSKTLEARMQRYEDKDEIQKVMSKHAYYFSAGMHKEEIEELWAQKTPGVTFAQNECEWEGLELVKECYVNVFERQRKRNLEMLCKIYPDIENVEENLGVGTLTMHTLTTPVIEVAGDGKTAKGVWMSPGQMTELVKGKPMAMWMWEKYGVDFVKEDGMWKIWHFHVYTDFMTPYEMSWVENSMNSLGNKLFLDSPPDVPQPTRQVDFYKEYSLRSVPQLVPKPPVPYENFDETFRY
ncbi:MAG: hypothetical protein H6Q72_4316 [Firmicutes bacterium]|nr:hypothetical protein [Bacillota bacterium]